MPLSKNKGMDQAELKDIRPIVVRSHVAKILEEGHHGEGSHLGTASVKDQDLPDRLQGRHLYSHPCVEASEPDLSRIRQEEEELRSAHRPVKSV